jgi:hypothetical protein
VNSRRSARKLRRYVTALDFTLTDDGVRIPIRAKPRASKSRVVGVREGRLEVAVAAPPTEGAANEELTRVIARFLEVPARSVAIVSGAGSRQKLVAVQGVGEARLLTALGRAPAPK